MGDEKSSLPDVAVRAVSEEHRRELYREFKKCGSRDEVNDFRIKRILEDYQKQETLALDKIVENRELMKRFGGEAADSMPALLPSTERLSKIIMEPPDPNKQPLWLSHLAGRIDKEQRKAVGDLERLKSHVSRTVKPTELKFCTC